MTADENDTWDKIRFFQNQSLFDHVQKKNYSTMTRWARLLLDQMLVVHQKIT